MSYLMDKLKRMEPFKAQIKQNLLKKQIKDPYFENSTLNDIDEKFNSLCNYQSQQLVNFELKVAPPQLDEQQLKVYSRNKTQKSSIKRSSTILQLSKPQSTRSSQIIQKVKISTPSHQRSIANSAFTSQILASPQVSSNNFQQLTENQKQTNKQDLKSQTQLSHLKTSASLTSAQKLSPIKTSAQNRIKDKFQKDDNSSPEKRLHQMRKNQGNIRFSKKKSTFIFNEYAEQSKQIDKESDIDEKVSQSPEWLLIQQKLKNAIKNKKHQHDDDYINPVVQLFGNNFIAMVLQALVIKKIDDLYGMKINTDSNIPISENLLKQFGISTTMLNSLNSANEKRQYIADTMTARISLMIKEWDEKQNFRQEKLKVDEILTVKEEERKNENQKDMFDWLKIETNHDQLKKKLRMSIIEKLTDFENQEELKKLKAIKDQQQIQNKSAIQKLEINLNNVPYVSTKVLLLRMDELDNKYLKEGMTKEQLDQYQEISHVDYMEQNKQNSQKQKKEKQQQQQQAQNDNANEDAENDELPEWSEELEKEFLNNKKLAKIIYSEDISVSNWNQQGYLPLVQEYNLSNKKKMEREQLITNYQNGLWLTEKELKFIADTSSLLNKCIDKSYVQKIVNHISKDDVSHLELSLAENIITNYKNMQNLIREQRLKFLKERQAELLKKREENRQKQFMKDQREKELKIQRRYVKMFKTIGSRLLSNRIQYTFDVLQKNFFCRMFFDSMKDILIRFRKRKEAVAFQTEEGIKKIKLQSQLANQKDFVKRLAKAENVKKICGKQHELHPPSKISYFPPSDEQVDPKREELMNFMSDRFKLSTRSKQEVRIKDHFQKFYSGGPQKSELEDQQPSGKDYMQKIQLTKQQFAGIVRVQRLFRQFRMRKIIQNMKEQEYSIKLSIYKEKLRSYQTGRKFLKITSQKLGREIIPQKLPIENFKADESQVFSEQVYSSDDEAGNYKDKTKNNRKNISPLKQQRIINHVIQTPKSNSQQNENIRDFYNLHSTYVDTISTDRYNIHSKTVEDENNSSRHQHSHMRFFTNDKNQTISNLDETDPNSNESPQIKSSKQNLEYQKQQSMKQENKFSEEGIRLSVTRCSNTDIGTTTNKKNNNASQVSFLSQKIISSTTTLLLKQQKLLQAAQANHFLQIRNSGYLFNQNDVNCKDKQQNTALVYAVQHQNLTFIRWLLSKGANINAVCAHGNTPVHYAFKTNNHEVLHDILCLKPDLNIVNREGLTPLGYASIETIKKFDLKDLIVFKNDPINIQEDTEFVLTQHNNNQMLVREKKPLKAIGKLKLNNFFPFKNPTIQKENYTSM